MNTLAVCDVISLRADYRKRVRTFFEERAYVEVDPPAMSKFASVDAYIDPFCANGYYLHTSPELAMKRLLAAGSGDIYFLGHVYRKEESGSLHSPEFTMAEWYKTGTDEKTFLNEVCDFIFLFIGSQDVEMLSYGDAYEKYAKTLNLPNTWNDEEKRHYTWAKCVEPNLGNEKLTIIRDFPLEEASLATTAVKDGVEVANRFEFYYNNIELANGFHELSDPVEQTRRFDLANQKRIELGKEMLPLDEPFIEALSIGLPERTYGMAAGFDRLLMLSKDNPSKELPLLL